MSVIFSKKCEYGLQSILFMAAKEIDCVCSSDDIARQLKIPKEFVSKILQSLTESGIVASKKGKSGGFMLAKSPSKIRLIDVVEAIDGLEIFNKCVLGFPGCSEENPCPVHNTWGKIRSKTYDMLSNETIDKLKQKTKKKLDRL